MKRVVLVLLAGLAFNGCAHSDIQRGVADEEFKSSATDYILCVRSNAVKMSRMKATTIEVVLAAQGKCIGEYNRMESAHINFLVSRYPDSYLYSAGAKGRIAAEKFAEDTAKAAMAEVIEQRSKPDAIAQISAKIIKE